MAFFDQLGQKLSQTSQDAVKKTKDMAEVVRLNSAISEENKKIEAAYREIGKLYYEHCAGQEEAGPMFQSAVAVVQQAETSIREMKETIARLKGVQICPGCGSEVAIGALFCTNCGAKQPDPPAPPVPEGGVCVSCGSPLTPGALFCNNCGTRQPDPSAQPIQAAQPAQPAPEPHICANCGAEMAPGMSFCTSCGSKLTPPEA